jgi:hypothetical protein
MWLYLGLSAGCALIFAVIAGLITLAVGATMQTVGIVGGITFVISAILALVTFSLCAVAS